MINPNFIDASSFVTYAEDKPNIYQIESLQYFDQEQYDLYSDKGFAKFIEDCEKDSRHGYESRRLTKYLRESEGMNCCTFLNNLSNLDSTKIRIELHHTPLTLYDIVSTVIRKRMNLNESIDICDVVKEVFWLHYAGWVGLVPVCETVHQMIHGQFVFVPTHIVRGNYMQFVDTYKEFIFPETLEALQNAEEITLQFLNDPNCSNIVVKQFELFNISPTYINIGNIVPVNEAMDAARAIVKSRIDEIKNGKRVLYRLIKVHKTSK